MIYLPSKPFLDLIILPPRHTPIPTLRESRITASPVLLERGIAPILREPLTIDAELGLIRANQTLSKMKDRLRGICKGTFLSWPISRTIFRLGLNSCKKCWTTHRCMSLRSIQSTSDSRRPLWSTHLDAWMKPSKNTRRICLGGQNTKRLKRKVSKSC